MYTYNDQKLIKFVLVIILMLFLLQIVWFSATYMDQTRKEIHFFSKNWETSTSIIHWANITNFTLLDLSDDANFLDAKSKVFTIVKPPIIDLLPCNRSVEPIAMDLSAKNWSELENKFPLVQLGGLYKPSTCRPHSAIAIIVPYRNRSKQLPIFLNHMHMFLQKQQLQYGIFIVEQIDKNEFNRGSLMNVGYEEVITKNIKYDCFVFHDVDLLPENIMNFYGCDPYPRHFAVGMSNFDYRMPYKNFFGGVCSLTTNQFQIVNGFSNLFWGWGGEDDDLYNRVVYHNFTVKQFSNDIGRYLMLSHKKAKPNPGRFQILTDGNKEFDTNGLNNLKYQLKSITEFPLYTKISVRLIKN